MNCSCIVNLDSLILGDTVFTAGARIEDYESSLGLPNRCKVPTHRAPYGYRNNVVYFFDESGIVLNEHHATHLIQAIYFILVPEGSRYQTDVAYASSLTICGVPVRAGMRFEEFASQCNQVFKPHLGHAWFLDGEHISLQFEIKKAKGKRGMEKGIIQYLCVGFRDAHRTAV